MKQSQKEELWGGRYTRGAFNEKRVTLWREFQTRFKVNAILITVVAIYPISSVRKEKRAE